MTNTNEQPINDDDVSVDQQDGGPGSHTEDGSGGETNDVASGGTTDEEDPEDGIRHDVHGDIDTVS